tara:strand:+ start:45 stop:932 length:888 start_codon:yes stop_codon:yes gene_type:complete
MAEPLTVAAYATGTLLGLWGASKSASAAAEQMEFQNEAREAQFEFENQRYDMTSDKIRADHAFAVKEVLYKRANERRVANWKDATNAANYKHQLMIRNREQASLEAQFEKSNVLYDEQIGFNSKVARDAQEAEWRKLQEINAEAAFDANEQRIEFLQAEGKARATGASGRSAAKTHQAIAANFGSRIAAMNEGLAGAGRETRAMLEEISNDQYSANLAAFAQKMLDPGVLPMPVMPFKTPEAKFLDPMPLQDFHFGPRPILGAMGSTSAAANQAWGAAIPGIASSLTGLIKAFGE